MAFLQFTADDSGDSDQPITLHRRITSLGAGERSDVRLTGAGVADEHATITCEGPHFTLRPTGSGAKVRINGKKVRRKAILEHGDQIELGDQTLEFSHLREPADPGTQISEDDVRRIEGLRQLHRLSVQLHADTALDELLDQIIDSTIELTDAAKGFLLLADDEGWDIRVARHVDVRALDDDEQMLSDSVLNHVLTEREPLVVADARNHAQFREAKSVINLQLCSVMCVPLLDGDQLLGAIYVGNNKVTDLFDELDLELLSIFAAKLSLLLSNAILLNNLRTDCNRLQQKLNERRFGSIVGSSEAMEPVFHAVRRVAPTDVTVLITGETGTGKELVAAELHHRSGRSDGPFVTINCGAIPENLLESELFGHVKGAFTGADAKKDGKFHVADGGTIFLDEIGEMPLQLQVKLLRVLQERSVSRVGSTDHEPVDIRVLAATNRQLTQRVEEGEFREDLYYRLNVVEIALPPLRERGEDVVLLAQYMLEKLADDLALKPRDLSRSALQAIRRYDWPGNVRQLENRIKKALVLATGSTIGPDDLDLPTDVLPDIKPLAEAKEEYALQYVLEVLERNGGNRSQTARDLDVDPRTVFRYLEKAES